MAPNPSRIPAKRHPFCGATACSETDPCDSCLRDNQTYTCLGWDVGTTNGNSAYVDNEEKLRKERESKAHFDAFIRGRDKKRQRR